MKRPVSAALIALVFGTWAVAEETPAPAAPATEATPTGTPGSGEGPCAADRQKFCGNVPKGGGAIHKCMMEHEAELSEACKARLAKKQEKKAKAKAAN
jgi:hypothetical protein